MEGLQVITREPIPTSEEFDDLQFCRRGEFDDWSLDALGVPADLCGKNILELFSGEEHLGRQVAQRGGRYFSLDLHQSQAGEHVIADATCTPYPTNSMDGVFMRYPTLFEGADRGEKYPKGRRLFLGKLAPDLFKEAFRVLSAKSGSFISIYPFGHIEDAEYYSQLMRLSKPGFDQQFSALAYPVARAYNRRTKKDYLDRFEASIIFVRKEIQ